MKRNGFTLLELLMAMAILAIIVTLAFPGSNQFNEKTRAEAFLLELKRHVMFARAKATTSDEIVILCPVDPNRLAASLELTCINNWKDNVIISFIDSNNDGVQTPGTDDILRIMDQIQSHDSIDATDTRLRFDSSGRLISNQAHVFVFCPSGSNKYNKQMTVSVGGTAIYNGDTTSVCS